MTQTVTSLSPPSLLHDAVRPGLDVPLMQVPRPALEDIAGWTAMVEQTNAMVAESLKDITHVYADVRDLTDPYLFYLFGG